MNPSHLPIPVRSAIPRRLIRIALVPMLAALLLVLALAPMLKAAASMPAAGSAAAAGTHGDGQRQEHVHGITLGQLAAAQRAARLRKQSFAAAAPAIRALAEGHWQAQFGAFSAAEAAERHRAKISQSGTAAAADLIIEPVGALYRLASQARETRAEVGQLCARANASGLDCFVRRVPGAEAG